MVYELHMWIIFKIRVIKLIQFMLFTNCIFFT